MDQPGGKEVLGRVSDNPDLLVFWCPGCRYCHHLETTRWRWNGDMVKPTASPSLLINREKLGDSPRCHLFVKEGRIQYLSDCTHRLAGQTIDMVPWEEI